MYHGISISMFTYERYNSVYYTDGQPTDAVDPHTQFGHNHQVHPTAEKKPRSRANMAEVKKMVGSRRCPRSSGGQM